MGKPVAVILVNYKKPAHTIACIKSLYEFCDADQFDTIVVDNASEDGSIEVIKEKFPTLTYLSEQENLGFAEGNNRGLRLSISRDYQYSLVINNDTVIDENLIGKLITHLQNNPETVAVQPAIYWMHQRDKLWNGPGFFNKLLGKTYNKNGEDIQHLNSAVKADWLTGCCMLIRNDALQLAGLFNDKFFLYYEDADLSFRLRTVGKLDYLPTAKLYHEAGISGKSESKGREGFLSPVIHYYVSRNHLWFIRQYGVTALRPVNLIYNLGYYLSVWSYLKLRGRNEKAALLLKGINEGLFTPLSQIWVNQ